MYLKEDYTDEINKQKEKPLNEFNQFLQDFYNQPPEEKLRYIKHFFYYNDVKEKTLPKNISGSEKELKNINNYDLTQIPENTKNTIKQKIAEIKTIQSNNIKDDSNLILKLFFDSLDLAEIKSYIQSNFSKASNPPITDLKTIWDLYIMAEGKSTNIEKLKDCEWGTNNLKNLLIGNLSSNSGSENILTLWKKQFKQDKNNTFCWDNTIWIQTKNDFIIKAYLISDYIKNIPWKNIWIMIPSVWSAWIVIIATLLAQKIPVMFNWTLWKESFKHCKDFSWVDKILTSSNFYEKVKNEFLDEYKNNNSFLFLEDLLKNITTTQKIKALINSKLMPIPNQQHNAVMLFTSWSENLPKAVPLTHTNLIENIKWALSIFELKQDDILLWFLPPFHSFWFTINTMMPLISGLRVVYTPDPNDAKTIIENIKHTQITAITSTPTFLKMILSLAKQQDLQTLRYVVVGTENCPQEVFDKFKKLCPNWVILEWYWITECSPVISINPISNSIPWSVWKVIPNLKTKILDINSSWECEIKQQWMIYISWSSIFNGYLDEKIENPFVNIDWEKYYKTWDLWYLDENSYLFITRRLKRFIKIAWEMISLPFIENILFEKYWDYEE